MTRVRGLAAVVAVCLLLLTGGAGGPDGAAREDGDTQVVVVLQDDVVDPAATVRDLADRHGLRPGERWEHALDGFVAQAPAPVRADLERDPRVARVVEDLPVAAFEEDTVPRGVARIGVPEVPDGLTGAGVRVAVLDTGIDDDHRDLAESVDVDDGYDCRNGDRDADDDHGHGTHVAGTITAAVDGRGVRGVAPGATLVPFKVLDHSGRGSWSDVICALDRITELNTDEEPDNDVGVVNLSLGGPRPPGPREDCATPETALYRAVCRVVDSGAVFVVAVGNGGADAAETVPAAYPEVVTVSAYQDTDGSDVDVGCAPPPLSLCDEVFASFSNHGEVVDLLAPGVGILSTTPDGGHATKSGTSMAAPHVAGVAALLLEADPDLSPATVESHLRAHGQCPDGARNVGPVWCDGQGRWPDDPDAWSEPLVRASWALAGLREETPTPGDGPSGSRGDDAASDPTGAPSGS